MVAPVRYRIKLDRKVITEDSLRFDEVTKNKIKNKCLEMLSRDPEKAGQPLAGELKGYRKLKMFNEYRIVFKVKKKEVVVLILAVGMRRDLAVYESAIRRLKELDPGQ